MPRVNGHVRSTKSPQKRVSLRIEEQQIAAACWCAFLDTDVVTQRAIVQLAYRDRCFRCVVEDVKPRESNVIGISARYRPRKQKTVPLCVEIRNAARVENQHAPSGSRMINGDSSCGRLPHPIGQSRLGIEAN